MEFYMNLIKLIRFAFYKIVILSGLTFLTKIFEIKFSFQIGPFTFSFDNKFIFFHRKILFYLQIHPINFMGHIKNFVKIVNFIMHFTKKTALEKGLILLTCGVYSNVIRFLYPLTIPEAQFEDALKIISDSMRESCA